VAKGLSHVATPRLFLLGSDYLFAEQPEEEADHKGVHGNVDRNHHHRYHPDRVLWKSSDTAWLNYHRIFTG